MGTEIKHEKLKFKLELYSTYWARPPIAEIKLADKTYFKDEITSTEQKPTIIEFEQALKENKSYDLIINRSQKIKKDTVIKDEKIVADQMLHIKYIEIDEIDMGSLIYNGVYTPIYPEPWATQQKNNGTELPESITNSPDLGHNGTWSLSFTSPFYMWLLENLY